MGYCVRGKLDKYGANVSNQYTGQDPCDLASSLQLPGTENIDNDPAFAPCYIESDEDEQNFEHSCETMGYDWSCNGEC